MKGRKFKSELNSEGVHNGFKPFFFLFFFHTKGLSGELVVHLSIQLVYSSGHSGGILACDGGRGGGRILSHLLQSRCREEEGDVLGGDIRARNEDRTWNENVVQCDRPFDDQGCRH